MKVLISGATGLVGRELKDLLGQDRCVVTLGRSSGDFTWAPDSLIGPGDLKGVSSIVHLAGAGIADRLWTRSRKRGLWDSRVNGTRLLVEAAKRAGVGTLISASGVGYYGDCGEKLLHEDLSKGEGFLADLAEAWEREALAAQECGIRVVVFRLGVVLSPRGGLLKRLLPIFRLGLGGRLGSGKHYFSWISLADVVAAFKFALDNSQLKGVYNLVAPDEVTNSVFTSSLASCVKRREFLPVPSWIIRVFLGQMGSELVLSSQRVSPSKLTGAGFKFQFPNLQNALESEIC